MTLTSKFKKDIGTLRAAANKEIFLDLKNPKLYKKIKRYYQNEITYNDEDPEYKKLIDSAKNSLSKAIISSKSLINEFIRFVPMKPAPPVTRILDNA